MAPEFLGSSSSSQSPTKPSTPTNSPPLSQRRQNDTCFTCRNKGHWAADCPFKSPPSQPPSQSQSQKACRLFSSPSPSSAADTSFFSPIPCPNCHGSCYVRISRSAKNPDRRYYSCFNGKCNFFKWYDQIAVAVAVESGGDGGSNSKTKRDRSRDGNPECQCGAGNCMRKFFVSSIQKGHGACSFRRGVDDTPAANTVTSDLTEGGQCSYRSPKRTKFESPVMDNPDPLSTTVGHGCRIEEIGVESKDHDDILDLCAGEEIVRAEAELKKPLQVSRLPSQAVRCRQVEFMRQISASEYATVADPMQQMLGTLITGSWLGRLAFPPKTGCLTVPQLKPFFCCVFPSFDPISVPKDVDTFSSANVNDRPHHTPMNAEPDSSLQIPSQDSQSGILLEFSRIQNIPGMRRGRDYTEQISKALAELGSHVQNQLFAMLESTEPHNHRSMTEAANKTFSILSSLSLDYRSFSEHVRKFISCASSLAEMEESMMAEQSTEEIMEWYDNERANSEKLSTMQAETKDAVTASEQQLKSLGEEASHLKEMLLQIEDQLTHCKKENVELKIITRNISEDMLESGKKLQEAEAAKKLHEEREREKNAAKESLERARIQLRHSVYMV